MILVTETVYIPTLTDAGEGERLAAALLQVSGVQAVRVSVADARIVITWHAPATVELLRQVIERMGHEVGAGLPALFEGDSP